jgi:hypothetical protein
MDEDRQVKIRTRVCVLIKHWVEKDRIEEPVKSQIEEFVTKELEPNERFQIFARAISNTLNTPRASNEVVISEKPPTPLVCTALERSYVRVDHY